MREFAKSELWSKLREELVTKLSDKAPAPAAAEPAAGPAGSEDVPMAEPKFSDAQKKELFHARQEGGLDAFLAAFDKMESDFKRPQRV